MSLLEYMLSCFCQGKRRGRGRDVQLGMLFVCYGVVRWGWITFRLVTITIIVIWCLGGHSGWYVKDHGHSFNDRLVVNDRLTCGKDYVESSSSALPP